MCAIVIVELVSCIVSLVSNWLDLLSLLLSSLLGYEALAIANQFPMRRWRDFTPETMLCSDIAKTREVPMLDVKYQVWLLNVFTNTSANTDTMALRCVFMICLATLMKLLHGLVLVQKKTC